MATRKRTALTAEDITKTSNRGGSVVRGLQAHEAGVLNVDPKVIAANPFNPPERSIPDESLAASIAEMEVLQPLLLAPINAWIAAHGDDFPHDDGAEWVVLDGHRRHAAALQAEKATVPAIERLDLIDKVDEVILAANSNRLALSPYEEALGFQRLINKGMKQTQIAKIQGVAQGHVSKRLSLLKLPLALATAVTARGTFGVSAALSLLEDCDTEVLERLAENFVTPEPGRWETQLGPQTRQARDAVLHDRAVVEAAKRAEELGTEVVLEDPEDRIKHRWWDYELNNDDEIAEAKEAGTLATAVINGQVRTISTKAKRRRTTSGGQAEEEREAKKAKKRREAFLIEKLAAGEVPFQGNQATLINRALKGSSADGHTVDVAAKFAVAAGILKNADDWRKHSSHDLKVSMANAVKLEYILTLAEMHQASPTLWGETSAELLDLLKSLGYAPTEREEQQVADYARHKAQYQNLN